MQEIPENLNQLVDANYRNHAERDVIGMALEKPLTSAEFHERILLLAALLRHMGTKRGDRVALLAENSHQWVISYMAVVRLGAVAVPILPDLPEADVQHILTEMECGTIFISRMQAEKIYESRKRLGHIITVDDFQEKSGLLQVRTFSECLDQARELFARDYREGRLEFPEIDRGETAAILYTSGTSGFSKAVMLSHRNLCANACSAADALSIEPGKVFLSVLPVAHTYEFTVGLLMPLIKGCRVVYAGKAPTPAVLQKICAGERPHGMLVVPLIMEKIYKKRVLPAIEKSRLMTLCCRMPAGRRLIHRAIGGKLLDFFGGRLEVMGIGGAALNPEVETFLRNARFPFVVGYGMTESSPLIAGGPMGDSTITPCSAGKPVTHVEVRIADPDPATGIGEVQVRGPNVMQGYWNDPDATRETFTEDGWLMTGDLGFLDDRKNLHIRGRSKSVIVLANGENVYPEVIEHKLNRYPVISESLVLENGGRLEAWVYPDYELVDELTKGESRQQRQEYLADCLDEIRGEVNAQLGRSSRLSRLLERREPFIKTATHKIKRYLYTADSMPG